jgi:hypothetical protein
LGLKEEEYLLFEQGQVRIPREIYCRDEKPQCVPVTL